MDSKSINCLNCGKSFVTYNVFTKFCCDKCKTAYMSIGAKKILVIDDWRSTAELIGKWFPEATVDHMYGLPVAEEDLAKLDEYDILFVDNEGIGNKQYRDGQEFLKAYKPKSDKQMVIYHSGLGPDPNFKRILDDKGFFNFEKCGKEYVLRDMIRDFVNNQRKGELKC